MSYTVLRHSCVKSCLDSSATCLEWPSPTLRDYAKDLDYFVKWDLRKFTHGKVIDYIDIHRLGIAEGYDYDHPYCFHFCKVDMSWAQQLPIKTHEVVLSE